MTGNRKWDQVLLCNRGRARLCFDIIVRRTTRNVHCSQTFNVLSFARRIFFFFMKTTFGVAIYTNLHNVHRLVRHAHIHCILGATLFLYEEKKHLVCRLLLSPSSCFNHRLLNRTQLVEIYWETELKTAKSDPFLYLRISWMSFSHDYDASKLFKHDFRYDSAKWPIHLLAASSRILREDEPKTWRLPVYTNREHVLYGNHRSNPEFGLAVTLSQYSNFTIHRKKDLKIFHFDIKKKAQMSLKISDQTKKKNPIERIRRCEGWPRSFQSFLTNVPDDNKRWQSSVEHWLFSFELTNIWKGHQKWKCCRTTMMRASHVFWNECQREHPSM